MKRSALLKSLSREHHGALIYAKRLLDLSQKDTRLMQSYWRDICEAVQAELKTHFAEEEKLVEGISEPLLARFRDEHRQLRALFKSEDADQLKRFANLLREHIRFEERELFPCLEARYYEVLQQNQMR
ncbi:Hemerythrin HHE cation binding domain-containing protein [Amphritea atlantica]|uniref:Hemerythrin HHE cation binding domain-containing protein n=1 Tax=Amphritea atlantica TaxID=355243 RepID=A0A1H9LGR5_9GAMM|nr:hemerythrin domain-containing protein [Amphritea atlantica]SER10691.1 Hemerythrin HHE cation binding domain-containing protein [Amphritea atlantica]